MLIKLLMISFFCPELTDWSLLFLKLFDCKYLWRYTNIVCFFLLRLKRFQLMSSPYMYACMYYVCMYVCMFVCMFYVCMFYVCMFYVCMYRYVTFCTPGVLPEETPSLCYEHQTYTLHHRPLKTMSFCGSAKQFLAPLHCKRRQNIARFERIWKKEWTCL